ncbi:NADH dehydrogenase subunit 4L [Ancistrocladus abbreviatus]
MLLAVNSNFLVFSVSSDDMMGQSFALLVPTVAAAESAIGLAIFVITFRVRGTIAVESINSIQDSELFWPEQDHIQNIHQGQRRERSRYSKEAALEERQEAQASQDQAAAGQIGSLQLLKAVKAKPLPQTTGSKGLMYVEAPMKKDLFDIELLQWPRSVSCNLQNDSYGIEFRLATGANVLR